MRLAYPNEDRFSQECFGDCPIVVVLQALEALERRDLEQANLQAVPVSLVGQYIGLIKGNREIQPEAFNPYGAYLYKQAAKETIAPVAARVFLELSSQQLIPAWAIAQVDVKQIRSAAVYE